MPKKKKPKRQSISRSLQAIIYEKYQGKCAICGKKLRFDEGCIDHIKPVSKGGTSDPSNLQLLCPRCNAVKGNKRNNNQVAKFLKGKK